MVFASCSWPHARSLPPSPAKGSRQIGGVVHTVPIFGKPALRLLIGKVCQSLLPATYGTQVKTCSTAVAKRRILGIAARDRDLRASVPNSQACKRFSMHALLRRGRAEVASSAGRGFRFLPDGLRMARSGAWHGASALGLTLRNECARAVRGLRRQLRSGAPSARGVHLRHTCTDRVRKTHRSDAILRRAPQSCTATYRPAMQLPASDLCWASSVPRDPPIRARATGSPGTQRLDTRSNLT